MQPPLRLPSLRKKKRAASSREAADGGRTQGTLDILVQRSANSGAARNAAFVKNNYFHDAFFLKAQGAPVPPPLLERVERSRAGRKDGRCTGTDCLLAGGAVLNGACQGWCEPRPGTDEKRYRVSFLRFFGALSLCARACWASRWMHLLTICSCSVALGRTAVREQLLGRFVQVYGARPDGRSSEYAV